VEQGYTAIKYSPKGRELTRTYIREAGELGMALREVVGPDRDISVDLGSVHSADV